jgi:uncharacterized DUF497 family protein
MPFEFDLNKSIINKEKHGIDFNEAQKLWEDLDRLVIPIRNVDELRFIIISKFDNKIWSAIFTMRNDNVRIISVRRARKEEIALYEI